MLLLLIISVTFCQKVGPLLTVTLPFFVPFYVPLFFFFLSLFRRVRYVEDLKSGAL